MNKLAEAKQLLKELQVPQQQQSDLCAHILLALCSLKEEDGWQTAHNEWYRIHDMILFLKSFYGVIYAENSRETIRKQALHHFRNAAFIEDNGKATNSPNYRYRLTEEMLSLIKSYGFHDWTQNKQNFISHHQTLINLYSSKRAFNKIPVVVNGLNFIFSTGKHNQLQKAIIEDFAPRFAPNSECLYVGDTTNKDLVKQEEKLTRLGFQISVHDKMPDVVLYRADKNWIYFIEAVTSVGPMSPKRVNEIKEMTANVTAGKVYVTAFLDLNTYKKFVTDLAWDTEIWIAENPDHMIHLNGDKFMGPRNSTPV